MRMCHLMTLEDNYYPQQYILKEDVKASSFFVFNFLLDLNVNQLNSINYYPFGSPMPERSFSSQSYRYGFNGMEKDDEVKGNGNHYDLGLRNYDSRLGRMFSIDPRANEYPWQTTYAYHRNNPIFLKDYKGGGDPPPITGKEQDLELSADGQWIFMKKGERNDSESIWMKTLTDAEVEKLYQGIRTNIKIYRSIPNMGKAADNLERWLNGKQTEPFIEDANWIKGFSVVQEAVRTNKMYFRFNPDIGDGLPSLNEAAKGLKDGESLVRSDYFETSFSEIFGNDELYLSWNGGQVKSTGTLTLSRKGNTITVTGKMTHKWTDVYNWEPGASVEIGGMEVRDEVMKYMEFYKDALPYSAEATWTEDINMTWEIDEEESTDAETSTDKTKPVVEINR